MININYDYTGKVQSIIIQINNYWVPIPYNSVTKEIDWGTITYQPTLDSIQGAWNTYLSDNNTTLEQVIVDRPDLATTEPQPQVEPQWGQFNLSLMVLPAYNTLMIQAPGYMAANLSVMAGQFATGDFHNYNSLKSLWDSIVTAVTNKPTTNDITSLNQLAQTCTMPFSFGGDGKLMLS